MIRLAAHVRADADHEPNRDQTHRRMNLHLYPRRLDTSGTPRVFRLPCRTGARAVFQRPDLNESHLFCLCKVAHRPTLYATPQPDLPDPCNRASRASNASATFSVRQPRCSVSSAPTLLTSSGSGARRRIS